MSRSLGSGLSGTRAITASVTLAALLGGGSFVHAQDPASPSGAPSVAGAPDDPGHSLGASLRAGGGWTRQEFIDASGDVEPVRSGRHASGAASVSYGFQGRRTSVAATGSSAVFHAPSFSDDLRYSHTGQLVFARQLARRTIFQLDANIAHQPVNVATLFPGMFGAAVPPIPIDYGLDLASGRYLSYGGGLQLDHELTARSSVEAGATYRRSDWAGGDLDLDSLSLFGRYRRDLGRGFGLRLGYVRGRGSYRFSGGDQDVYTDTIDAGVDYARTLSVSRRTSLAFSTGTTAVTAENRTRWDVIGSVSLAHEMGRSWSAAVSYNRHAGFVDVLAEPAFTDNVAANLSGLLGRRVSLTMGAGASRGTVGINDGNDFSAQHATVGLQTSVTRLVGVQVSYIYYRYRFGSTAFLPVDFGNRVHQQSVQASITIGVPLLTNSRTTNAAR